MNSKKEEKKTDNSYFVVDTTGTHSVTYSDPSLNSKVQFIWKDEIESNNKSDEEDNEYIPKIIWSK